MMATDISSADRYWRIGTNGTGFATISFRSWLANVTSPFPPWTPAGVAAFCGGSSFASCEGAMGRLVGRERYRRWLEAAGLGRELAFIARRRS
jgi:hypothetical protein